MQLSRIKCKVSYDGGNYGGFQLQDNVMSIQQRIEEALQGIVKVPTRIYASGRTDAGVHARGQVFHFDTSLRIPEERWPLALNAQLPDDIVILEATHVPSQFHARFDAIEKTYRYCLWNRRLPDVFTRKYAWHIPYSLDIGLMREATRSLIGEQDFTSFCAARAVVKNKIRHVYEIEIHEESPGQIWLTFRGNGFLYNMVRIMVGTLIQVGSGKVAVERVQEILEAKDRRLAGMTAPPEGLFLWNVKYEHS
ncbi:tRNA pseudouridine(38-40) synthase TruA [Ammoniphilus oxalaticus]|uniref:tRNA pseudouridine synthase A n=1 Tax=Ammoniphilus oxalaticus TaxID=66863 RepID=A0A419SFW5_9BACL|nr:tRNA pseudouridine(38-40) synthase TruA [Ammoniphilus oxalaticus]RKD22672.1 tRNA pseudouridine(38-40) synthase TruA [Ammoniphilus oxalaticus]